MLEDTETAVPIIARPGDEAGTVRVVGGQPRVLVCGEQVKGTYAILEQEIPAGKGPPLHVHRHETEIFYVISGEFEFCVVDDVLIGGPGTNAVCPRDIPHTIRNVTAGPACLHVTIVPGNFGNFFQEVDALPSDDNDAVRALAAEYDVEILE